MKTEGEEIKVFYYGLQFIKLNNMSQKSLSVWLDRCVHPHALERYTLYLAVKKFTHLARGRILDIGCGDKQYAHLFTGVDHFIG